MFGGGSFSTRSSQSNLNLNENHKPQDLVAVDSQENLTLTTRLDNQKTLKFDLKLFDFEGETVSFFQLELSEEALPESIRTVFKNTKTLFEKCFEKKTNYQVRDKGIIVLKFKIQLDCDTLKGEIVLTLKAVQNTEANIIEQLFRKQREFRITEKEKFEAMKKIVETMRNTQIISKTIIPFKSQMNTKSNFMFKENFICFKGGQPQGSSPFNYNQALFVLNTVLVNPELFEMTVVLLDQDDQINIGVVSETNIKAFGTQSTKSFPSSLSFSLCQGVSKQSKSFQLCYSPYQGAIYRNEQKIQSFLQKYTKVNTVLTVKVNRAQGTVVFSGRYMQEYYEYVEILKISSSTKVYPAIQILKTNGKQNQFKAKVLLK